MNVESIFKYGYGLLKLDQSTLYSMDLLEFMERVEGALLWHEFQLDEMLNNHAWYVANMMMATGNMKKGTSVIELKKGLYKSLEDVAEEQQKAVNKKKNAQEEKAKLMQRFNLDASTIK